MRAVIEGSPCPSQPAALHILGSLADRGTVNYRQNEDPCRPPALRRRAAGVIRDEKEAGRARTGGQHRARSGCGAPSAADTAAMFGNADFLAWFAEARQQ
jgi:hypothetical protein